MTQPSWLDGLRRLQPLLLAYVLYLLSTFTSPEAAPQPFTYACPHRQSQVIDANLTIAVDDIKSSQKVIVGLQDAPTPLGHSTDPTAGMGHI